MSRDSASPDPPAASRPNGPPATPAFASTEWRLLTRLPGQAVVAATLVPPADPPQPGHAVGIARAGLEGIAAGRAFDSELVRAVVRGVFAEADQGRGVEPARTDRRGALADLYAACGAVVGLLAERADLADSAAYRQWVQSAAVRVCRAAWRDAPTSDPPLSAGQQRFLDNLGTALNLP
ncbi:MAG TPA: hypothetical protein VFX60_02425 [Micromonospora sp.]|nr:hypothetical protein [Micromonospora sp.]